MLRLVHFAPYRSVSIFLACVDWTTKTQILRFPIVLFTSCPSTQGSESHCGPLFETPARTMHKPWSAFGVKVEPMQGEVACLPSGAAGARRGPVHDGVKVEPDSPEVDL